MVSKEFSEHNSHILAMEKHFHSEYEWKTKFTTSLG